MRKRQPAIGEVISRRTMLKGMAAGGAFGLFGCGTAAVSAKESPALTFPEVKRASDDKAYVPPGYDMQVLIAHGDPIRAGGPGFRAAARATTSRKRRSSASARASSPVR